MNIYENPRLITPPKEEEEVYPYRRAWRSVFFESSILISVAITAYVLFNILGLPIPQTLTFIGNILLALLPALLWFAFSRLPEDFSLEPRRRLLTTFTVSALVANAIGIPFIETIIQPDRWLPLTSLLNRIIGYTATVAAIHEILKYLVVRYLVWPDYYRVRSDSVAYSAASALGYVTVINIHFALNNSGATWDATALVILADTTVHLLASIFIAYGMSESFFSNALTFLQPGMFITATLLSGIAFALRPTFVNATLGITTSAPRDIFGLFFSIVFFLSLMSAIVFLYRVAERRAQDKLAA